MAAPLDIKAEWMFHLPKRGFVLEIQDEIAIFRKQA